MRLRSVELREQSGRVRLVGQLTRDDGSRLDLYFDYSAEHGPFVTPSSHPFLVGLLTLCMKDGESLESDIPVAPQLAFNLPRIRDIFHAWFPGFARIPLRLPTDAQDPTWSAPAAGARAASFFSGGVDSLYTLLKRRFKEPLPVPLTHVIFMRGVETRLERSRNVEASIARTQAIADQLGVTCIVGETNLRSVARVHWEHYQFGSGLAAVALSLAHGFRYVCIPSSYGYGHMEPHGSTPLVDEMYSTEQLSIVHDGGEASRATKTALCLDWHRDLTLRSLRVCTKNDGGDTNCCRCYKCVRTAAALAALGAFTDAESFPDKSRAHWADVMRKDHLGMLEDNLALARETGRDPELLAILERTVARKRRRQALKDLIDASPPARRALQILGRRGT